MRAVKNLGVILTAGILFLAACAPEVTPAPQVTAPPPAAAPAPSQAKVAPQPVPTKPAWQAEWERVVAAAKSEGRIMLTITAGGEPRRALTEGFQKAYEIPAEVVVAPSGRAVPSIEAERRAGIYLRDVYLGGGGPIAISMKPGGMLAPMEPLLMLPDLTEPELIKKSWYEGKLQWVDKDHSILAALTYPGMALALNTTLVKEGEITSWRDLLNPKWKGAIAMLDPGIPGTGTNIPQWAERVMGWDWMEQLAKNEPVLMQDHRLMTEWLAHGKVAVVMAPSTSVYSTFKQAGAPLKNLTPKEGTWVTAGEGCVAVLNRAAHPNTARVFINWLLSKEGQTVLAKSIGGQSAREDVPTNFLDPEQVRVPGVNYPYNKEKEELYLSRDREVAKAKAILSVAIKK